MTHLERNPAQDPSATCATVPVSQSQISLQKGALHTSSARSLPLPPTTITHPPTPPLPPAAINSPQLMGSSERESSTSPTRRGSWSRQMSALGAKIGLGRTLGDVQEDRITSSSTTSTADEGSERRSMADSDASSTSTKVEYMERRQSECAGVDFDFDVVGVVRGRRAGVKGAKSR